MVLVRGREFEAGMLEKRPAMGTEVMFGAGIALGFGVEVSVFDVQANGEADARVGRQIFAEGRRMGRSRRA